MYTKNPFARQFIVSWVSALDSVPDINMLVFLPEILDGLFLILGDPNQEIRKMCESTLVDFLRSLPLAPPRINYSAMTNILIVHSQSADHLIQYTAITWLKEFIQLSGRRMLHFSSGLISAILPCFAYNDIDRKIIRDVAKAVNHSLRHLVSKENDVDPGKPDVISSNCGDVKDEREGEKETEITKELEESTEAVVLDVETILQVLTLLLGHTSMLTRIAALRWVWHLLHSVPNKTFLHIEPLFPALLDKLADPSDEVVLLVLELLAEISSNTAGHSLPPQSVSFDSSSIKDEVEGGTKPGLNDYFTKFINKLTGLFRKDSQLLDDRGSFIIRQLAILLNAEDIYRSLSERILLEDDLWFATTMVQTLNTILLTSSELFSLRSQLKELRTKESCSLFCCLYKSWCHSPVATVSLCYLTQNYRHACDLTLYFGNLEVTVDFLKEIDKLVQLIESPIFSYLRLQLLDVRSNQSLIKSLYGLLMLLPQSEAFKLLHYRLQCIPHYHLAPPCDSNECTTSVQDREHVLGIDFNELMKHFICVQDKHSAHSRRGKRPVISHDDL